ncbi:MAG: DUF1178 family protein [Pseudomonadota bacterium]
MIRFALRCDRDHPFDSWFASAQAYDALAVGGKLVCPVCGSARIAKGLMAPAVTQRETVARTDKDGAPLRPLDAPATALEEALAALRRQIEENSEYVGMNFAVEARAIHDGDAPARSIHGEARADEARKLLEDGVPVAPLPFVPLRRVN